MLFRSLFGPLGVGLRASLALVAVVAFSTATVAQTPQDPGVTTPSAFASSPSFISVSPNDRDPSYAVPYYISFPVTINNGGGSDLNNIRISGYAESATLNIAEAFGTITPVNNNNFSCSIDTSAVNPATALNYRINFKCTASAYSLPPGQILTVRVAFLLPQQRSENESVAFGFTALFREGLGSGSTSSDGILTGATTTSVQVSNDSAGALLVSAPAKFFTGRRGVPQASRGDNAATLVEAPALLTGEYANATIGETSLTAGCPVPSAACKDKIELNIINKNGQKQRFDPAPYLVITLRRDALAFKGGINNIPVYYYDGISYTSIPPCVNGIDPLLGGLERCVFERRIFRKSDQEVRDDPELLGDAQVRIYAKENGELYW